MRDPTKKLGPIGSAVLTFIGYKQTNRQTSQIYIVPFKLLDKHILKDLQTILNISVKVVAFKFVN